MAGFFGGILSSRVMPIREHTGREVIRARSFELVNETGEVISLWGVDQGQNAILAFASRGFGMNTVKERGQSYVLGTFLVNRDKIKAPLLQPR